MSEAGGVRGWVLAFLATAGLGFGALIGIGCALGANACPFTEEEPFTATGGREIWLARCASCHGLEGRGGRGPSLVRGESASVTEAELRARISRGRPLAGMPAFKRQLSERQIAAVARYVVELREAS